MSDSSPTVLIVEDDQSLASALESFFKKKGYHVVIAASAETARRFLRERRIRMMIVDCLLPGENGVDFVTSIRTAYPASSLDVVLMSGIFVESSFIKESVRSTQSLLFLKKPFELNELTPLLGGALREAEAASPRRQLYQAFAQTSSSDRERKKLLESLEEINGFDLPFIYSLLLQSQISGHLNIVDEDSRVFGVTFAQGHIVGVDLVDSETVLGKLLIESGYILPQDLEEALASKSSKRIGETLISNNLLSPHGFEIVLANQMSIRMSRTIVERNVRVNFVAGDIPLTSPAVDGERLDQFIHDWVASKLTLSWLKAHFTPYGDWALQKGPVYRLQHPAFTMPLVVQADRLADVLFSGVTVNAILERKEFEEENLLRVLHFLICVGVLVLRERPRVRSIEDQRKHLRNIHLQMRQKKSVEIYDLMVKMTAAPEKNPETVMQQFSVLLGAPPAPSQKEDLALFQEIMTQARAGLKSVQSGDHGKIRDELARDEIEKKLKASRLFDDGRQLLEKSQFTAALGLLEKVEKLDPQFQKLRLYLIWARLGNVESHSNKTAVFKSVDADLLRVEPEDKFDSLFSFVNGLYAKTKGDLQTAKRNFEKSIAMDSTFIPARRELAVVATLNKPKPDVFNQDLKELVGSLFKKK